MHNTGLEAWIKINEMQKEAAANGESIHDKIALVLTDLEMPEMDGYTLTAEVRNDPRMHDLHIVLHTSLSGAFNQAMVKKVGADDFLAKFRPDDLASLVIKRMQKLGDLEKIC